jgi:competence protein ComEC
VQIRFAYLLVGLSAATVSSVVAIHFARFRIAGIALLSAIFLAGVCLICLQSHTPPHQLRNLIDAGTIAPDEPVKLKGDVSGPVELARDGIHLTLRVEELKTTNQSLNCSGVVALNGYFRNADDEKRYRQLDLQSATSITVRTKLNRTEQHRNPGVATLAEYLDSKDIDAIAEISEPESIHATGASDVGSLSTMLYQWRAFLQRRFDSHFSNETAAVLSAALLGNRYNISTETSDRFREGGTFHILVISGAHISFLGTIVLLIARRLIARRWLQVAAAASVVWLYTIAVGADVSVVRAAFMFSFVAAGHLLFRLSSPLNSLGAAALVLLVWSPKDLFDPALQLTFLSVLAILGLAWPLLKDLQETGSWRPSRTTPYPPTCSRQTKLLAESLFWSESDWLREQAKLNHSFGLFKSPIAIWLERHHLQRPLRYLFVAVVVSISVQLVLLPLQILYFHRLSLSSLILNIVVGVLLTVLAAVALVTLLIIEVSSTLAAPLVIAANAIDWLMLHSVDPFARLGIASLRVAEYSGRGRAIYILYYIPLLVFAYLLTRCRSVGRREQRETGRHGNALVLLAIVQLLMAVLLVSHPRSALSTHGQLRLDFLDVGQGDSALITMPDGATLLIDGGGKPQFLHDSSASRRRSIGETVVCEYLWHRGLGSVDYVLATHADADHIDGLNDVVTNFNVRSALVGRTPPSDPAFVEFAQTLSKRNTPLQIINAGDVLRFGRVEIDVLWPYAGDPNAPSRNNDSVVLRIRFGERTFLLTGDIERTTEEFLSSSDRMHADVIKVPHHGSRTSSTSRFVTAVQPSFAVISVGRRSMFGHPHAEVVERWRSVGAQVLTTGDSGTITVITDGRTLSVMKFVE